MPAYIGYFNERSPLDSERIDQANIERHSRRHFLVAIRCLSVTLSMLYAAVYINSTKAHASMIVSRCSIYRESSLISRYRRRHREIKVRIHEISRHHSQGRKAICRIVRKYLSAYTWKLITSLRALIWTIRRVI